MPDRDDWVEKVDEKPTKLMRASDDRVVAGVCAGIARFFGWTPTRVRTIYVVVSILSAAFPGMLVYLILWLLMPVDGGRA